jgi:guanosine-3',5'-bis(diphosphate) 3'-pyrophosphohydrolase
MDGILQQVRDFADRAHGDQRRKYTPERYIVHPVRVMEICRQYNSSLPVLSAALLHDVLEDTPVTKGEIYDFLSTIMSKEDALQTIELVVELTDVYIKKAYPQWNRKTRKEKESDRIALTSPNAQTIKYADIIDNSKEIVQYDEDFGPKFLKECRNLLKRMNKDNPDLYKIAIETVEQNLKKEH